MSEVMNAHSSSNPIPGISSIVETLRWRALHQPERRAYTFLRGDGADTSCLSYAELDHQARAIGTYLQDRNANGKRVLLFYPPGLEYVKAVFGCLYAGAVAVPAYPPRRNQLTDRLHGIVADAQARFALTTTDLRAAMTSASAPAPDELDWIVTDDVDGTASALWVDPGRSTGATALLQYTSGSTTRPKGVVVTHGNLLHNMQLIRHGFQLTEEDRAVFWLPPYHDMGLIGGILGPAYLDVPVVLLAPSSFLQRPVRWLEALAHHRATISGGPNFAYDLCAEKISRDQREQLDLRSWRLAFTGAEPIRAETCDRFATTFADSGFRRDAFYPCYGLAETTLIAAGGAGPATPITRTVNREALERHAVVASTIKDPSARVLVGCGSNLPDMRLAIVDPKTLTECSAGRIGEVCVSGPSVAQGYWNRPEETARMFGVHLTDHGDKQFFRTGDLGFILDGELFVTGRLKNLIVIRGRNYYPHDIELTVGRSHPSLRRNFGAAFTVEVDGEEQLVIVQEIKRRWLRQIDVDSVLDAVQDAVAREYQLPLRAVMLIKTMSILKTSSGKIQHHLCRTAYLEGTLKAIGQRHVSDRLNESRPRASDRPGVVASFAHPDKTDVTTWLIRAMSRQSGIKSEQIDVRRPFASYGLSSVQAVEMSLELEEWLGLEIPPTVPYDYPTIESLAGYLADLHAETPLATAPAATTRTVQPPAGNEPIAVVGMGCRFPGADSPDAFWQLLSKGIDAIREVPTDRQHLRQLFERRESRTGATPPRWGGFLERIDEFDPAFFGINPREAVSLDPQQRLLLEVAWEALEDAGQAKERLRGSDTGVVIGISSNDYGRIRRDDLAEDDPYVGTGNASSIAANRLSYVFDLRGPSLAVDTACSSSLVAVHHACQLLRSGECGLVLAGGVNVILSPTITASFATAGLLAADGRCKSFDARADGYVRSEGAGVVVLKRVSRALADGDSIVAVIRGSSVNTDGRTNGLTAPSRQAQESVLRAAYLRAEVTPSNVQYIEAHGTGTALGDPIEAEAIGAVMSAGRAPNDHCIVGSVKTNVGHLEAAAGIAGFIKTVLALQHAEIPRNLHFRDPNPNINFDRLGLRVADATRPWPEGKTGRLAGVSSFGFGGANAHVVLASAPSAVAAPLGDQPAPQEQRFLLPLSAECPEALHALASSYCEFLSPENGVACASLTDVSFSASVRRSHHDYRAAFAAETREEMQRSIQQFLGKEPSHAWSSGQYRSHPPNRLVFVFSGQGSQWWAMGRGLLEHDPVFRATVRECDQLIQSHAHWSVVEELSAPESASRLSRTEFAQPALFTLQLALAARWRQWGIVPDALLGHSLGEVAAAHLAGVLSLDDAVRVVMHRARLMARTAGMGKMAAVELSADDAREIVANHQGHLSVAAENGPRATVLSGVPDTLDAVLSMLRDRGVPCRELPVDYAFHSAQMAPLQADLAVALKGLQVGPASLPVLSTAGAQNPVGRDFDAGYWTQQIANTVRFGTAVDRLIEQGHLWYLEVGPHPVLTPAIQQSLRARECEGMVLSSLRWGVDERTTMLASLGNLYTHGYPVDWRCVYPAGGRQVRLPSYPWQRARYWLDEENESARVHPPVPDLGPTHPLLGPRIDLADVSGNVVWENTIDSVRLPYLLDHRFGGRALFPGTAYAELGLAAAAAIGKPRCALNTLVFRKPLFVSPEESRAIQCVVSGGEDGLTTFRIFSRSGAPGDSASEWTLHAHGKIADHPHDPDVTDVTVDLNALQRRPSHRVTAEEHFGDFEVRGFSYGPAFRGLRYLSRHTDGVLARIDVPENLKAEVEIHHIHPAVLDACMQTLIATDGGTGRAFLPLAVACVAVYHPCRDLAWSLATADPSLDSTAGELAGDVRLLDENGLVLAEARGLRVRYLDQSERAAVPPDVDDWLYRVEWEVNPHTPGTQIAPVGTWWFFLDAGGVGERVAATMAANGHRCIRVVPGAAFARTNVDRFQLRPGERDDMRQLFAETIKDGVPDSVGAVHLWSLDAARPEPADIEDLKSCQTLGAATVVDLVREMASARRNAPSNLWLVTRGAQPVGESTDVGVAQSPLWGLGRTIIQEQPGIGCRMIDLDPIDAEQTAATVLSLEIQTQDRENQIGYRNGIRHVARLVRNDGSDPGIPPLKWRTDGSYLVTGGFGGLGRQVARWMIAQGARHIVLLGRTKLPPRPEWGDVESGSRLGNQITAVYELEALGADVQVASVDVADDMQLGTFFERFRREGRPPVRGVVHAAGVLHDDIVSRLDSTTLDTVFQAKVSGGWLLHHHLRDADLDFFVMFSSAASILGSIGQGNYAAANAFLDALAHHRHARAKPGLSINWGPWAEVGMATLARRGRNLASQGIGSIPPERGLELLGRMVGQPLPQVGVIPIDWGQLSRAFPEIRTLPLLARLAKELSNGDATTGTDGAPKEAARAAILAANPEERQGLMEAMLSERLARAAGFATVDLDRNKPLDALGIDSLANVDLKLQLERDFGMVVPVVRFLESPTIVQFATMLLEEIGTERHAVSPARPEKTPPDLGPVERTAVVPLQPTGAEHPLFFLHPGALDVQCYSTLLPYLDPSQPVYVLAPPGLENYRSMDEQSERPVPIEQVAMSCLDAIDATQPEGAYRLAGWSLGGVVAYEVAMLLRDRGGDVEWLALLDSPSPASTVHATDHDNAVLVPMFASYLGARRGRILRVDPDALPTMALDDQLATVLERAASESVLPTDVDVVQLHSLFEVFKNGLRRGTEQLRRYRPGRYAGSVTYLRAQDETRAFKDIFPDATSMWAELVSRPLEIREVPGDHYSLFLEPQARRVAEELTRLVAAVRVE